MDRHGARRLASAIILLAIRDARKGDTDAAAWLDSPHCEHLLFLLDIDPDVLQRMDVETVTISTVHSVRANTTA